LAGLLLPAWRFSADGGEMEWACRAFGGGRTERQDAFLRAADVTTGGRVK